MLIGSFRLLLMICCKILYFPLNHNILVYNLFLANIDRCCFEKSLFLCFFLEITEMAKMNTLKFYLKIRVYLTWIAICFNRRAFAYLNLFCVSFQKINSKLLCFIHCKSKMPASKLSYFCWRFLTTWHQFSIFHLW